MYYTASLIINGVLLLLLVLSLVFPRKSRSSQEKVDTLISLLFKKGIISHEEYFSFMPKFLKAESSSEKVSESEVKDELVSFEDESLPLEEKITAQEEIASSKEQNEEVLSDHHKILSVLFTDEKKRPSIFSWNKLVSFCKDYMWFFALLILVSVFSIMVTYFANPLSSLFLDTKNAHVLILAGLLMVSTVVYSIASREHYFAWWGSIGGWCLAALWYVYFFSSKNITLPYMFFMGVFFLYGFFLYWLYSHNVILEKNLGSYFTSLSVLFLFSGLHLVLVPGYIPLFYFSVGFLVLLLSFVAGFLAYKKNSFFSYHIFFLLSLSGILLASYTAFSSYSLLIILATLAFILATLASIFYDKKIVFSSILLFAFVHINLLVQGIISERVSSFLITQRVFAFFYVSLVTFFAAGFFYKIAPQHKNIFLRKVSAGGVFVANILGLMSGLLLLKENLLLKGFSSTSSYILYSFCFIAFYGIMLLYVAYRQKSDFLHLLASSLFFVSGLVFFSLLLLSFSVYFLVILWTATFLIFGYKKKIFSVISL